MTQSKTNRAAELASAYLDQLATNLDQGNSEALTAYLQVMARFRRYSFHNTLLIFGQKPTAQHVAGFGTWKKLNRWVKSGEKGIAILAPTIRKMDTDSDEKTNGEEGEQVVQSFITVYVFDVTQTDGEPIPEFATVSGEVGDYLSRLRQHVSDSGIRLGYTANLGGALGISHGNAITILSGLDPATELQTLAHELAHEKLHRGPRRNETTRQIRELEAEAVSYVVTRACGLENVSSSWDYIRLYGGDRKLLAESLHHIHLAAADILVQLGLAG